MPSPAAAASASATINPANPIIGGFNASPDPIAAGSTFTLSATSVTDPNTGGAIASVAFYLENNGTAGLQTGTGGDTLLGTATTGTVGVWSLPNVSTTGLAASNYTYYAVATDTYSAISTTPSFDDANRAKPSASPSAVFSSAAMPAALFPGFSI